MCNGKRENIEGSFLVEQMIYFFLISTFIVLLNIRGGNVVAIYVPKNPGNNMPTYYKGK